MNKLARKICFVVSAIIILVTVATIFINTAFVQRFYIREQKKILQTVGFQLSETDTNHIPQQIDLLEQEYDIVILNVNLITDNDRLNAEIRDGLNARGISFQKLWLWDKDQERLFEKGSITKLYGQEKLRYSILIQYTVIGDELYVITMNIPHAMSMIRLTNLVTFSVFAFSILIMVAAIHIFIQKITNPLLQLTELANDISQNNFRTLTLNTNDELQILADSINQMSISLEHSQAELEDKNKSMKQLLSDVSHEIRTPVSLIKAYSSGIRDGMDDGSFLDVIDEQTERINGMVSQLLDINKMEQEICFFDLVPISDILLSIIEQYQYLLESQNIHLEQTIQPDLYVSGNSAALETLLRNLVTNAVKYTSDQRICLELIKSKDTVKFKIKNNLEHPDKVSPSRIFDAFYVGEHSRNKDISGYGLGLSMVKTIVDQFGYRMDCQINEQEISFLFWFPIAL